MKRTKKKSIHLEITLRFLKFSPAKIKETEFWKCKFRKKIRPTREAKPDKTSPNRTQSRDENEDRDYK